jgi:hypothetical protein
MDINIPFCFIEPVLNRRFRRWPCELVEIVKKYYGNYPFLWTQSEFLARFNDWGLSGYKAACIVYDSIWQMGIGSLMRWGRVECPEDVSLRFGDHSVWTYWAEDAVILHNGREVRCRDASYCVYLWLCSRTLFRRWKRNQRRWAHTERRGLRPKTV